MLIMATKAFSLRFRRPGLRSRVAQVAAAAGVSQNEFLEQAAEHEVIIRGGMIQHDLESAAAALKEMAIQTRTELIKTSIIKTSESESAQEPIAARAVNSNQTEEVDSQQVGVVAAFYNAS